MILFQKLDSRIVNDYARLIPLSRREIMVKPNVILALAALAGISIWQSLPSKTEAPTPAPTYETSQIDVAPVADPAAVETLINLGEAHLNAGQCNCAIVKLSRALDLDPGNVRALSLRAQAYDMKGDWAAAVGDIHTALIYDRQNSELWHELAQLEVKQGHFEAALVAQQTALTLNPLNAELWAERSDILRLKGEVSSAQEHLLQAQRIQDWDTQNQATHYAWQTSEWLNSIDQSIETDGSNAYLYYERAYFYWHEMSNYRLEPKSSTEIAALLDLALTDLNISIALNSDQPEFYLLRSQVYRYQRDWTQALSDLHQAESLSSETLETHLQRAQIMHGMGDTLHLKSALSSAYQALALATDSNERADVRLVLGQLHISLRQWDRAFEMLSVVIHDHPYRPEAYYHRAVAGFHMSQTRAQASDDLEKALMLWQSTGSGDPHLIQSAHRIASRSAVQP